MEMNKLSSVDEKKLNSLSVKTGTFCIIIKMFSNMRVEDVED